jgi:methyl-accepting chemotaxis protein
MNLSYEFSKIRDSFGKVREDMHVMKDKINQNYDNFLKEHTQIANKVEDMSQNINENITNFKKIHKSEVSRRDILNIKDEIKDLKEEINNTINKHHEINNSLSSIKAQNKDNEKQVNNRVQSSELEIYLLKEKMIEKDLEIKQMKEVNIHMLKIIDELTKLEVEVLNNIK